MRRSQSLGRLILTHELTFLFLAVLIGLLGGLSSYFWQQTSSELLRVNQLLNLNERVRGALARQIQQLIRAYTQEDPQAVQAYAVHSRDIDELFNRMRALSEKQNEAQALQDLQRQYRVLQQDMNKIFDSPYQVPFTRIQLLDPRFSESMVGYFDLYYQRFHDTMQEQVLALDRRVERWTTVAGTATPLILLLAAALVLLSRRVLQSGFVRPMERLIRGASVISKGNLEHRLETEGVDEIGKLSTAINRMSADLHSSRDALVQSERQAALGALVPVVAHNIRNPLASIRAMAQVMQAPSNQQERLEHTQAIIDTIDRLGRWVSALVSYLHPLQPSLRRVPVTELMDAAVQMLDHRILQKQLRLRRTGWESTLALQADPDLVEQALYNLLLNAVDASPKEGDLVLGIHPAQDRRVEMRIRDHGPGLRFNPNPADLSPGPSSKRFGTGLGLPIAFKIFRLHGWQLSFDPGPAGGTEARILAPLESGNDGSATADGEQ